MAAVLLPTNSSHRCVSG